MERRPSSAGQIPFYNPLPGVPIGKYAIVVEGTIVTKDVGDYEVAIGVHVKIVKT